MSLIETLAAATIFSLLISVLYAILIPTLRHYAKVEDEVSVYEDVLVATRNFTLDAAASTLDGLLLTQVPPPRPTDPVASDNVEQDTVAFLSCLDANGTIQVADNDDKYWMKYIEYQVRPDQTLHREVFFLDKPVIEPGAGAIDQVPPLWAMAIGTGTAPCRPFVDHVVARGVIGLYFDTERLGPPEEYKTIGMVPPRCNPVTVQIWFLQKGKVLTVSEQLSAWGEGALAVSVRRGSGLGFVIIVAALLLTIGLLMVTISTHRLVLAGSDMQSHEMLWVARAAVSRCQQIVSMMSTQPPVTTGPIPAPQPIPLADVFKGDVIQEQDGYPATCTVLWNGPHASVDNLSSEFPGAAAADAISYDPQSGCPPFSADLILLVHQGSTTRFYEAMLTRRWPYAIASATTVNLKGLTDIHGSVLADGDQVPVNRTLITLAPTSPLANYLPRVDGDVRVSVDPRPNAFAFPASNVTGRARFQAIKPLTQKNFPLAPLPLGKVPAPAGLISFANLTPAGIWLPVQAVAAANATLVADALAHPDQYFVTPAPVTVAGGTFLIPGTVVNAAWRFTGDPTNPASLQATSDSVAYDPDFSLNDAVLTVTGSMVVKKLQGNNSTLGVRGQFLVDDGQLDAGDKGLVLEAGAVSIKAKGTFNGCIMSAGLVQVTSNLSIDPALLPPPPAPTPSGTPTPDTGFTATPPPGAWSKIPNPGPTPPPAPSVLSINGALLCGTDVKLGDDQQLITVTLDPSKAKVLNQYAEVVITRFLELPR